MWIKVHRDDASSLEASQDIIYVSQDLADKLKTQTKLIFGQREISISVKAVSSLPKDLGTQYDRPAIMGFSTCAFDQLILQESAVYQLRYDETTISIGPVIGFLLGDQHYYYHHRRLKGLTYAMGAYEKVGGLFIAFRYCSIDWEEKCIYGLYFNSETQRWQYGRLPLPSVVYRRGFNSRNNFVNEDNNLADWKVFNEIRFDKWQFHKRLQDDDVLQQYLPETALLSVDNVGALLKKYSKVILKPTKLSRGRGISILTAIGDGDLEVDDYRRFIEFKMPGSQLAEFLSEGTYLKGDYIVQQFLEVPRINDSPWDIRVVMQKDKSKRWICNGIECRVAVAGKLIANLASGGKAVKLSEALELAFGTEVDSVKINKDIHRISLEFCEMMDRTGYHFAEFGLDLAIDQQLHYWFIEANVRPSFNGFKKLDEEIYRRICYEPIFYSASIAGFGWEDKDGSPI